MKKIILLSGLFISCIISSYGQGTWSQSNLSSISIRMGAASLGSKIYIAGGARGINLLPSTIVNIYDVNTQQWTTSNLSVAREFSAGINNGSKVIFAGGINFINSVAFADVDIYDTLTQQWTTAQLSQARFSIATASYGNEVLFAGGVNLQANLYYATVDKYNTLTGVWSTDTLSEARAGIGFAVAGTKAIFAGGIVMHTVNVPTHAVDIYDFNTGIWTTDTLSLPRCFVSATAVGNKIIIAGGMTAANTPSDRVDIYDVTTGNWTTSSLSVPRAFIDNATHACGNAFFVGGGNFDITNLVWTIPSDVIDIYDPVSNTWTVEHIPNHASLNHAVLANGNRVFVVGGTNLISSYNTVDIYTCSPVGIDNLQSESSLFSVYPNPANDLLIIFYPSLTDRDAIINIADITGKIIYTVVASQTEKTEVNIRDYPEGVYLVQIKSLNFNETRKVIVARN